MNYILYTITILFSTSTVLAQIIKPDHPSIFKLNVEQSSNKGRVRYSVLSGYREGVVPIKGPFHSNFSVQTDTVAGTHRIIMYNLSIQDMLTHGMFPPSRVILEVRDPSKYSYHPSYGSEKQWLEKNGYCYELMMPIGVLKNIDIVNDELCRLFKIKCDYQKRIEKTNSKSDNVKEREIEVFVITEID